MLAGQRPPLSCRTSPPPMGRLAASPFLQRWRLAKPARHPISPLVGEISGRTEGGAKDRDLSFLVPLRNPRCEPATTIPCGGMPAAGAPPRGPPRWCARPAPRHHRAPGARHG
ncbi:hypothetical protein EN817_10620 [Mesorhizobium sp. M3A.F.Ca.ET.174.01.1.1]|nr:hypothetical protein EN818_10620 [Mesorhizobium sp. M3A.F.Ca.ET.175.01.1.1]TGT28274.1 hypothetical protein EN817_10620 [Mesorhizobium sp. M3A.F.Ca.ET.174.01.1.1]